MANLDNFWNKVYAEAILKENRTRDYHPTTKCLVPQPTGLAALDPRHLEKGWQSTAKDTPRPPSGVKTPYTPRSAAVRFLEEKTGLSRTSAEYADDVSSAIDSKQARPATRELLYHGIAHEGSGRAKYLQERKKYGVMERHGLPQTTAHTYGLTDPAINGKFAPSTSVRKPIIQRSFFRNQGFATYREQPCHS